MNKPAEYAPQFEPYFGCNHEVIPQPDSYWFGGFRYREHIGRPLTEALWKDLVSRAGVTSLWVLAEGDAEWCLGRGPGSATIYYDKCGLVSDVYLAPHFPCHREHVKSDKPFVVELELGACIGHTKGLEKVDFS